MTGTVLEISGVTHTYELRHASAVTALHDVDLVAERGELVCLAGRRGRASRRCATSQRA
jgi:ABC-type lipoprotein export system ATPase subunit